MKAKVIKKLQRIGIFNLCFDIFCIFVLKLQIIKSPNPMQDKIFSYIRKSVSLFVILFFAASVSAQTQIENFIPGSTLEGVCYYLPRTAFRLVVTAEKTVTTPGEFHSYAYKYMRIQNVPVHPTTTWEVKSIQLIPYGTPDKDKAYSLKLKPRTVAPLVSLTTDGLLLGINTKESETHLPPVPESKVLSPAIQPSDIQKFMTREMLQAGSVAKMAELVAQEIYDIRESRDALLRGEADNTPKDGQQLKLMIDNLELQQRVLGSLFVGTTEVSQHTYAVDVVPAEQTDKMVLFRFSKWSGLVDSDDMSGVPYYMSLKTIGELPPQSLDAQIQVKRGKMLSAVYYNVPAQVQVCIFSPTATFVDMQLPMAQFGYTEVLSGVLFDKKPLTKVSFFQQTGGIKEIKADILN